MTSRARQFAEDVVRAATHTVPKWKVAEIRADERRRVVAEIVAAFEEQLKWQRDTGCHEMSGTSEVGRYTPEVGRYTGWVDALAEVRKHAGADS